MSHMTNKQVLKQANTTRRLLGEMKKRQMEFTGHVLRKKEMECLLLTGKIDGKKSRGRPRQM